MRKRNIGFLVRLTEEEYEIITRRIKRTLLSREAYTRSLLLGVVPKEKPDERFYLIMRELSAIGNNINQLARKAAALGFIDVPLYKREAERWNTFRIEVKRKFLEPQKLEPPDGRH